MHIRQAQFTDSPTGAPAVSYEYHIGVANEDPTIDDNKLQVLDGVGGAVTSNPCLINSAGYFQNLTGQRINPWADVNSYAVTIISPEGGIVYQVRNFSSDTVTLIADTSAVVDATFNNFALTVLQDLSTFDTIYIRSFAAAWEDTVAGPIDGFYAHKNGTTGTPSSGTPSGFFDAGGEGWEQDDAQRIGDNDVSTALIQSNAITLAKMADNSVSSDEIVDGSVNTAELATDAVNAIKIEADAVTTVKILDSNVTTAKINDLAVTEGKLANASVATAKIQPLAVGSSEIATDAMQHHQVRPAARRAIANFDIASE